jgi:hypothetical protein
MVSVVAYPVRGKRKSAEICEAFVAGCGGEVATDGMLRAGKVALFYGVDDSNVHVWKTVRRERLNFLYIDNSYFDQTRGTHFRVSRNALQHSGVGDTDGKRFKALGIKIKPWRKAGDHVVLCPQSDQFMRVVCGVEFDWLRNTLLTLGHFTSRQARVREWNRDKAALARTLDADLVNAHALITWSSAAAVMAVLAGVPVVTMGPCAAAPMAGDIADVEDLPHPERDAWAGVLADHQWTLDEMRAGMAWEALRMRGRDG